MTDETSSAKNVGLRQKTHESVDKIMDKAEQVRDRGKEELNRIQARAAMMKGDVDGYIRKNPEKSVLIAAGIGAVAGAVVVAAIMRNRHATA